MTSYDRGDVILVDIAFSGAVGYKRRPAVVISTTIDMRYAPKKLDSRGAPLSNNAHKVYRRRQKPNRRVNYGRTRVGILRIDA